MYFIHKFYCFYYTKDIHLTSTTIIGILASIFTGISLLPQLIKLIKEKKASDISMWMLATLLAGLALWIWYGFRIEDWIIIFANLFSLCLNLLIVIINLRYKNQNNNVLRS
ncbi:MAG: SemiSWEET transporter [Ginsengibacter sp.]